MKRIAAFVLALSCVVPAGAQDGGSSYALLVGGLGGTPAYTETFSGYLLATRRALVERHGFADDHITVLAEPAVAGEAFVDGPSTAEALREHFAALGDRVTAADHVVIVLFGHGSYDGTHASLNIPRRDLQATDFAALVGTLPAGRVVFVNTTSASGPFAEAVSGPDRVVLTATRTGTQRDETVFPRFFVEALTSPDADLDKDGRLSVREAFTFATRQAAASFDAEGLLATEHALLEDTGDGRAARLDELDANGEGALAAVTYFARRPPALAAGADGTLLGERERLERDIAEVKARKADLAEDDYYARLEDLFVQLARLNDRLEQ